jgi:hypothetical protein
MYVCRYICICICRVNTGVARLACYYMHTATYVSSGVYVYTYVCIYVYTYIIYVYTYIHTYVYTYTPFFMKKGSGKHEKWS